MAPKKETSPTDSSQVKRVQPYPFTVEIIKAEGTPPIQGHIHKLTDIGFLMRTVGDHHFKVGDNHQARFSLPVIEKFFNEPIKIIKTYDSIGDVQDKELKKNFTIEMHFRSLPEKKREEILKFIQHIGQK